jgi:hypothetical protein
MIAQEEPLSAHDIALRHRAGLNALATLAELVESHEQSLQSIKGLPSLLRDAADRADALYEAIRRDNRAVREATQIGGSNG